MPAVMGIETEYGILAPAAPELDPAVLSAAVVDAWAGPATHHELSGAAARDGEAGLRSEAGSSREAGLSGATDRLGEAGSRSEAGSSGAAGPATAAGRTAEWGATTAPVPIPDPHNRVLGNGARLYVDHAHPEYSSPEVSCAADAVIYDLAGERIVVEAAALVSEALGTPVRIFKNNTDSKGSSYGCHENYLLPRSVPWSRVVADLTAFLVTRTVVIGAGRVGIGRHGERPGFQLSQRADFFETPEGIETTRRRPILNTRDEPHAHPERWRRLHVITGDANRSVWSTWLKLGTAALVLDALVAGALPALRLADPVGAMHAVSHDLTLRARLDLTDGRRLSALEVQQAYLQAVAAHTERTGMPGGPGGDSARVLRAWDAVLTDLAADPARCADRLDWVAKLALLESYAARHGLAPGSPRYAQLDLAWAELSQRSPYAALSRSGRFRAWRAATSERIESEPADSGTGSDKSVEAMVRHAVDEPPADTRAWLRGKLVQHAAGTVVGGSWDWMLLRNSRGRVFRVDLSDPLDPGAGRIDAVLGLLAG